MIFLQGKFALQACILKTQLLAWNQIKKSSILLIGHAILFCIQSFIGLYILGTFLEKLDSENYDQGIYTVARGEQEIKFEKNHSGSHNTIEENELEFLVILLSCFAAVLFSCLSFLCCCGCIFGSYFKFYFNIKEYNHIVELTSAPQV